MHVLIVSEFLKPAIRKSKPKIYFPKIRYEEFKNIIEYVNTGNKVENEKMNLIRDNINNDLILENEIMNTVEKAKRDKRIYNKILKQFNQKEFVYYVTQSLVSLNLRFEDKAKKKIDLFRLFNEFEPTDKYPFIQYQSPDGNMIFKYTSIKFFITSLLASYLLPISL